MVDHDLPGEAQQALATVQACRTAMTTDASPGAWRKLIAALERLVSEIPPEHAQHGMAFLELCSTIGNWWARSRDPNVWQQALELALEWRKRIPPPDGYYPIYVLAHGLLLYVRADATEEPNDLDYAISVLGDARSAVRDGAFVHRMASTYLANLLLRRFERGGRVSDLEASIQVALSAVRSQEDDDPRLFFNLKTLVLALFKRFNELGSRSDLDIVVRFAEEAVLIAPDKYAKGDMQMCLGSALRERFHNTSDNTDLDRAIEAHEHALRNSDPEDSDLLATRLDNLANGFVTRYDVSSRESDLEAAIKTSRKALDLLQTDSPHRTRILRNLGLNIMALGRHRHDLIMLEEAIATFRNSLHAANNDPAEEVRPLVSLAEGLLLKDTLVESHEGLDEAIELLQRGHEKLLSVAASMSVTYRLAQLNRAGQVSRRLIGALLRRANAIGLDISGDLRKAFEVGESGKSTLLVGELMRRTLPPPQGVPATMIFWEGFLLARLAGLDALDLAPPTPVSHERQQKRMRYRISLLSRLESLWDRMIGESTTAKAYVTLRKSPTSVISQLLDESRGNTACLSLLDTLDMGPDGRLQPGLAIMALWPGASVPVLLNWLDHDPLPCATSLFAEEVPNDRGRERVRETWAEPLVQPLSTPVPKDVKMVAVSPSHRGLNLPWHLLIERAGWSGPDDMALPVVIVPTLGLLALELDAPSASGWHEIIDIDDNLGVDIEGYEDVTDAIQVTKKMPSEATTAPLVVGNPSLDLEGSEREAGDIAKLLDVEPLIGSSATESAVRSGLKGSRLIHLAAHARFDESSPLSSKIRLADGELEAREVIGLWSTAALVVLSACESGGGGGLSGGELSGLATAMLRAGVRTVVGSLWPVDDAATAFLMRKFYIALGEGLNPPAALTTAMAAVRNQPGWGPPYYWAGFAVTQRGLI